MGPRAYISNKLFGNGDTTIPQNVLNVEQLRIFFFFLITLRNLILIEYRSIWADAEPFRVPSDANIFIYE